MRGFIRLLLPAAARSSHCKRAASRYPSRRPDWLRAAQIPCGSCGQQVRLTVWFAARAGEAGLVPQSSPGPIYVDMRIVLRSRRRGSPADDEAPDPGGGDDNDDAGCFSGGKSSCRRTSEAISGWTSGSRLRTGCRLPSRRPVFSEDTTPFEFAGGSLRHIGPERSDEPSTGLERHLATTFARD